MNLYENFFNELHVFLIHVVDDTSNDQTIINFNEQEVYSKDIIQNIQMIDFHIIKCSIQLNFKSNQYILENAFEFGRLITKAIESNPCQSSLVSTDSTVPLS